MLTNTNTVTNSTPKGNENNTTPQSLDNEIMNCARIGSLGKCQTK